jgi:hypothetical protein
MLDSEEIFPLTTIVKSAHCVKLAYHSHHEPIHEKQIIQNSLTAEKRVLKKQFILTKEGQQFSNIEPSSKTQLLENFEYKNGDYKDLNFIYNSISFSIDYMSISDDKVLIHNIFPTTKVTFYNLLETLMSLLFISKFTSKTVLYKFVYLHTQFTYGQPTSNLFIFRNFTKNHLKSKEQLLTAILDALPSIKKATAPDSEIGMHCVKPYDCAFKGSCWPELPHDSVFYVHNMSKKEKFILMEKDQHLMSFLKKETLTYQQTIQRDSHTHKKTFINHNELSTFMNKITYPLHFLDFEAVHFSFPLFENIKPFQALPFQFSLHKQQNQEQVPTHHAFLGEPGKDPRYLFLKTLLESLEPTGSIIAFDTHFERETLVSLASQFPEFKDKVKNVLSRFIDLSTPFQKYLVYSYKMKGKYSLKEILPAFIPDLSYTPLSISSGEVASRAYVLISYAEKEHLQKRLINQLKEYCFLDTYALYRLTEILQELTTTNLDLVSDASFNDPIKS